MPVRRPWSGRCRCSSTALLKVALGACGGRTTGQDGDGATRVHPGATEHQALEWRLAGTEPDRGAQWPGSHQAHIDVGDAPVAYAQPRTEIFRRLDEAANLGFVERADVLPQLGEDAVDSGLTQRVPSLARMHRGGQRIDVERLLTLGCLGRIHARRGHHPDGGVVWELATRRRGISL